MGSEPKGVDTLIFEMLQHLDRLLHGLDAIVHTRKHVRMPIGKPRKQMAVVKRIYFIFKKPHIIDNYFLKRIAADVSNEATESQKLTLLTFVPLVVDWRFFIPFGST